MNDNGNIIQFPKPFDPYEDVPANDILNFAIEHGLKDVVIVGWDNEGKEFFSGSMADGCEALWLLERAKYRLMKVVDNE